ncbi:UDP-N-acetylmuramoyl-tripeptide--D-alanyl-D-alanine ligase [bacterium]|nr:MAG: UDP-N-acetylmuramoyl-tripeptide--D-alanyl-D-alanine ligase [bacterium]
MPVLDLTLTWEEAAAACGGRLTGPGGRPAPGLTPFARVCTDNRAAKPGDAFFALKGDRFDAHRFLDAPLAAVCSGWVVRRGAKLPDARPPVVCEVEDTREALAAVAGAWRSRFDVPVVGVTGSNGKTTVKQMAKAVLGVRGPVCATAGNFNNEVGLPLSVLELAPKHKHAVFEMGASKKGDISWLARVAKPTAAVLTNVQPAHLEFFGDLETVFRTKSELLEALPPGAPAVLCADDENLRRHLPALGARAWTFGRAEDARVRVLPGSDAVLSLDGIMRPLPAAVSGPLERLNAAAAAALGLSLGLSPDEVVKGLAAYEPAPLRFAVRSHPSGARLVVDAYNANPGSMRAGLESFLAAAPEPARYAVLGDMKELGKESEHLHAELGTWLAAKPLAGVWLAGPEMQPAVEALRAARAPFPVAHAADPAALVSGIRARLGRGTALYVKGSRAMHLETLVEAL